MKKTIPILALIFWTNFVQSQADTALLFTQVITTDSLTAEQSYDKAMLWVSKTFTDANKSVQTADKTAWQIVAKGKIPFELLIPMGSPGNGYISMTVNLFFKQGRTKIEVTGFTHDITSYGYPSWGTITSALQSPNVSWAGVGQKLKDKNWNAMQKMCSDMAEGLIASYKAHMQKPEKADW